jgi:hypothetical protein
LKQQPKRSRHAPQKQTNSFIGAYLHRPVGRCFFLFGASPVMLSHVAGSGYPISLNKLVTFQLKKNYHFENIFISFLNVILIIKNQNQKKCIKI